MGIHRLVILAAAAALGAQAATEVAGDSQRGEKLFTSQRCIQCHSINGKGGTVAPDLGRVIDRNFSPALLTGLMWNHAPEMWRVMRSRGIEPPKLSAQDAADLFAYFYSVRFFDKPGDAARGKQTFAARHCADCHGITTAKFAGAPPVTRWESLGHPIILAQQMWNHGAKMREAYAQKRVPFPVLTTQELDDILVYLRNLPETKSLSSHFYYLEPAAGGDEVFQSKGCPKCHPAKVALESRLRNQTLTDIAVDMWNHQPKMVQPPPQLSQDDMRKLVSYLWVRQFVRSQGSAARGKRVFTGKRCASCHLDPTSGAPDLAPKKGNFSAITMIEALWQHGPKMLEKMGQRHVSWPRFDGTQMSDLIAWLNVQD